MSIFTNYYIQVECLLTWFPVRNSADLKEPKVRMHRSTYHADDLPFSSGNQEIILIGEGNFYDDSLVSSNLAYSNLIIGVDEHKVFFMDTYLELGRSTRKEHIIFKSNTITPFLFTLLAMPEEDPELNNTAIALQGVVTASPRRSELIYFSMSLLSTISLKK